MYTWGYIEDVTLAKLDMDPNDPLYTKLAASFKYYANEVMTQVCSTIKPKPEHATIVVDSTNILQPISVSEHLENEFVSFGDDINTVTYEGYSDEWNEGIVTVSSKNNKHYVTREAYDSDFKHIGYDKIMCYREGTFEISCNTRWIDFTSVTDKRLPLNIPTDILDCIPSYIASQCFKIDDEYKSSVFRNEYEMMLARIDNTNRNTTKTFTIGGGW